MNEPIRQQAPHRVRQEYGDVPNQALRIWANGPEDRDLDVFKVIPGPFHIPINPHENLIRPTLPSASHAPQARQLRRIKVLLHIIYMISSDPDDEILPTPLLNSIIRDLDETRFKIEERVDEWLLRHSPEPLLVSSDSDSEPNQPINANQVDAQSDDEVQR